MKHIFNITFIILVSYIAFGMDDHSKPVEIKQTVPFDFYTDTTGYIKYRDTELIYEYSYSGMHLVQMIRDNENVFILQFADKDESELFMLSYIDNLVRSEELIK